MHKVAICEDHDVVVEGVKLILGDHPEYRLCGHARNEAELHRLVQVENPGIVLLDLNLKTQDGLHLLQKLKTVWPSLKVIIFTMYEEPFLIEKAQKLNANGYLLKNSHNGELMEALRHVTRSTEFYLSPYLTKQKQENDTYRDEFVEKMRLTNREIEIIKLIAQGKAAKEIADQLFLSLHTVDTHRKNILTKLKMKNIADLVRFAFENHLL